MSRFFFLFSFLLLILWFYKSSTVVPSCFLEALHLTQNSCNYERNTFYQNLQSSTVTTFYLEPQSDSALLFFLLIQVINGLMDREDWQEAIQIPLGILPGGSGNALAASVHHYSQWVDPLMSHLNAWANSPKDKPSSVLEKKRQFISCLCNYAKGWLGTSFPQERNKTFNCFAVRQGHFRFLQLSKEWCNGFKNWHIMSDYSPECSWGTCWPSTCSRCHLHLLVGC